MSTTPPPAAHCLIGAIAQHPPEAGAPAHDSRTAWGTLVTSFGSDLHRAALAACGDKDLADDAVQEALLHIRAKAGRFRAPEKGDADAAAAAWMRRIARCCALELLRRRRRAQRRERLHGAALSPAPEANTERPDPSQTPQASEQLRGELAALADGQRQAVLLHYVDGLSYEAVAGELGCSPGAARVRAHRGLQRLRQRLTRAGALVGASSLAASLQALETPSAGPPAWIATGTVPANTTSLSSTLILGGISPMATTALAGLALATCALLSVPLLSAPAAEHDVNGDAVERKHEDSPRESQEHASRVVEGVITDIDFAKGGFTLHSKDTRLELRPRWSGGIPKDGGGPDQAMLKQIRNLRPDAKVAVTVVEEEGPRAIAIKLRKNGPEHGTVTGEIVELDTGKGIVVLQAGEHRIRLMPHWRGGMPKDGGGLVKETIAQVREFKPGDTVTITWTWEERYRIETIKAAR